MSHGPPTVVHVAYCQQCGSPVNVGTQAAQAKRITSFCKCAEGVDNDGPNPAAVVRYRLDPPKKRSARKRRKAWKR